MGKPIAYIANDNETIYLWDGHAVAYLYNDKAYGFNGRHLGWFIGGIIYDLQGLKIGFVGNKCPSVKSISPIKSVKHVKSIKSVRSVPNVRPVLSIGYSDRDFEAFLESGE